MAVGGFETEIKTRNPYRDFRSNETQKQKKRNLWPKIIRNGLGVGRYVVVGKCRKTPCSSSVLDSKFSVTRIFAVTFLF